MSKLSELRSHIQSIEEIKDILNAMRNLSVVEANKVSKFLENQKKISNLFKIVLEKEKPIVKDSPNVCYLLIGSERGFCGVFNEKILQSYLSEKSEQSRIIVVGKKLESKLDEKLKVDHILSAPSVVEEIPLIARKLQQLLNESSWDICNVIYNQTNSSDFVTKKESIFEARWMEKESSKSSDIFLYLEPRVFYKRAQTISQEFKLEEILSDSFLVENKERLSHMEGAISKIERKVAQLGIKKNILRQEEITQELEILLLNTKDI